MRNKILVRTGLADGVGRETKIATERGTERAMEKVTGHTRGHGQIFLADFSRLIFLAEFCGQIS